MRSIFLSYRRDDSAADTDRIHEHLVGVFSKDQVFRDVDSIRSGIDFRDALDKALARCDIVLVIIGKRWLSAADGNGRRRLDDSADFVRLEVETALKRGIPVIPVAVSNAHLPQASELPESLRNLAFRNALLVRPDPDFPNDMKRLIGEITRHYGNATPGRHLVLGFAALAAAVAGAAFLRWPPARPPSPQAAASGIQPLLPSASPPLTEPASPDQVRAEAARRLPARRLTADLAWLAQLGVGRSRGGLEVSVTANHPSGEYQEGERMEFTVRTNRDAYLYILHADAGGKMQMLFPNPYSPNNAVRAETDVVIPPHGKSGEEQFGLKASPPYGPELIKAIASTHRLRLDGLRVGGTGSLGRPALLNLAATRGRLTRGIDLVAPKQRSMGATPDEGALAVADCPVAVVEPR